MNKLKISTGEQIHYIKLIRETERPLEHIPAKLPAGWETLHPEKNVSPLKGIRAVLFDLYGTLFGSTAGNKAEPDLAEMKEYFLAAVKNHHEKAKALGNLLPEVNAEEIWAAYQGSIPEEWELPEKTEEKDGKRCLERELALRYELACNPVSPMPHAETTLRSLAAGGYILGIISNAQFYSLLLFNAFFNASPTEMGFDPELQIYSFMEQEAKPSLRLFAKARENLARRGIKPEEILFVGNDMKCDIVPAAAAGFKTALYAGDNRFLRLGENDTASKGKKPNMVISSLQTLVRGPFNTDNKGDVF